MDSEQKSIFMLVLLTLWADTAASDTYFSADLDRLTLQGNVMIAGLFDLYYSYAQEVTDGFTAIMCSGNMQDRVFEIEAMIYAINQINADPAILPNVQLGYTIQASCNNIIDTFFALELLNDLEVQESQQCQLNNMTVAALIGPPSSSGSSSISNLFRLNNIPVISYGATDPDLSSSSRFPNFYRTIFSDATQAQALADIIRHFHWTYIAVVASNDTFGQSGVYQIKQAIKDNIEICIVQEHYFNLDDFDAITAIMDNITNNQRQHLQLPINVTVLFMDMQHAYQFFQQAYQTYSTDAPLTPSITWLGVDQWSANYTTTSDLMYSVYIDGALTVEWLQPQDQVQGFYNYENVRLSERLIDNPWLRMYVCQLCQIDPGDCGIESVSNAQCQTVLKQAWSIVVQKEPRVSSVINAVYAVAHAIDCLIAANNYTRCAFCNGTTCPASSVYMFDNDELMNAILQTSVAVPGNASVAFDLNGDIANPMFTVRNFYKRPDDPYGLLTRPLSQTVGTWDSVRGLVINDSMIHWRNGTQRVSSVCASDCPPGEHIIYSPSPCCWSCEQCGQGTYTDQANTMLCMVCPAHQHPTVLRDGCVDNERMWFSFDEPLGWVNIVASALGELAVLTLAIVWYTFRKHKAIASAGSLGSVVLLNCAAGFTFVASYVTEPDQATCTLRIVVWAQVISMHCIGGMFLTTNGERMARKLVALVLGQRVPVDYAPHLLYAVLCVLGLVLMLLVNYLEPVHVMLVDMGDVDGRFNATFVTCEVSVYSILYVAVFPAFFWLPMMCWAYGSWAKVLRFKKRQETFPKDANGDDITQGKFILYSSYAVLMCLSVLTPIFLSTNDPWLRTFLQLLGAFCLNTLVLMFQVAPRIFILIFHKDYPASEANAAQAPKTSVYISTNKFTVNVGLSSTLTLPRSGTI